MAILDERHRQVLTAVIREYVETGEPVGSRAVARRQGLGLSPATIRNAMADLEELGYLSQPHTSAGRVPTDLAFRFYVDGGIVSTCWLRVPSWPTFIPVTSARGMPEQFMEQT